MFLKKMLYGIFDEFAITKKNIQGIITKKSIFLTHMNYKFLNYILKNIKNFIVFYIINCTFY